MEECNILSLVIVMAHIENESLAQHSGVNGAGWRSTDSGLRPLGPGWLLPSVRGSVSVAY